MGYVNAFRSEIEVIKLAFGRRQDIETNYCFDTIADDEEDSSAPSSPRLVAAPRRRFDDEEDDDVCGTVYPFIFLHGTLLINRFVLLRF